MKIIETNQLTNLFEDNPIKGQRLLPELIKKIVVASCNAIGNIRFPSGDSIWIPGFDGVIKDNQTNSKYAPLGNSFWEMGTNNDSLNKVNEDYKKRTKAEVEYDKKDYCFIRC